MSAGYDIYNESRYWTIGTYLKSDGAFHFLFCFQNRKTSPRIHAKLSSSPLDISDHVSSKVSWFADSKYLSYSYDWDGKSTWLMLPVVYGFLHEFEFAGRTQKTTVILERSLVIFCGLLQKRIFIVFCVWRFVNRKMWYLNNIANQLVTVLKPSIYMTHQLYLKL